MKRILLNLFLSFFLIAPLLADDNPRLIGYPDSNGGKIMGFKGIDTSATSPTLEDGRAIDAQNVKLSASFDLKKRDGYSVINDTLDDLSFASPAITGIFDAEYSTGTSYTIAFIGNKIKFDNSGTWTDVTLNAVSVTSGQDNQWGCILALDTTICTNNVDQPVSINTGNVATPVGFSGLSNAITKANAHIWFRNYLIFGNTTENSTARPTRFRWSDVGTIGAWTDANFVDIASFSGDSIVSFQELYGELYIIMRKSIWKATLVGGNDVFAFTKVVDGIGSIAKGSVKTVVLPNDRQVIIFLSEEKRVFLFNGVVATDIGGNIQETLDGLNASRLEYAVAIFDGYDYFLSVSSGGVTKNDLLLDYQVEINEWTKHTQIDANAFARVKESTSVIKTYFGNYKAFIYWLDNPDNINDVDGATGIIDSVGYVNTDTMTAAQILIDTGYTSGVYTGAIIRITSGTGVDEEQVVLEQTDTGIVVSTAFTTTPDSTSNYSIGDIDAFYESKWYDYGDASRYKMPRDMLFWAKEDSNSEVTVNYSEDFGGQVGSETKSLSPSSSSLWDVALWDVATWGTTGDKLYNVQHSGICRVLQVEFEQDDVDKTFHIYGFHLLAESLDRE